MLLSWCYYKLYQNKPTVFCNFETGLNWSCFDMKFFLVLNSVSASEKLSLSGVHAWSFGSFFPFTSHSANLGKMSFTTHCFLW